MIRNISFTPEGNIRIEGAHGTDIVSRGVVLLTLEQAREAVASHGWGWWGPQPAATETLPHLYAVKRT